MLGNGYFLIWVIFGLALCNLFFFLSTNKKILTFIISMIICVGLGIEINGFSNYINYSKIESVRNKQEIIEQIKLEDSIKHFLLVLDIKDSDLILKQIRIETENFTSYNFIKNSNLFNIKTAYIRQTNQISTNNGYGVYKSWQMCIIDYVLYTKWINKFIK